MNSPHVPGSERERTTPTSRRTLIIAVSAAFAAALVAVLGTWMLARDARSGTVVAATTSASAAPSPTVDSAGQAACTAIHHKAHPGADGKTVPSKEDWQYWARDVTSSADLAAQSSNRSIRRAGEDLKASLAGETFIPAFVVEAATALRLACDREDYINLYGPDR